MDAPTSATPADPRTLLLDAADDAYVLLDRGGRVQWASAPAHTLAGLPALEGADWRGLVDASELGAWNESFARACGGHAAACASALRRGDGTLVAVEAALRPCPGGVALRLSDPLARQGNDEMLRWVARVTAPLTGEEFFRSVVTNLAIAFRIRRAMVAECIDVPTTRVRTLAYWFDGALRPDFEFDLAGTPCEVTVRDGRVYCVTDGLARQYPRAGRLGLDGYLGAPIFDGSGQRLIGHVAFETGGPLDRAILGSALFQIFVSRAAAELRRKRAEEQARQHLQQLARVGRVSAMGEMASAIAHEVNQPLTALRTNAQACERLLAAGHDGAELAGALQRIAAQAERAAGIISRLRGFMARDPGESVSVDPNFLVSEVADLVRADAETAGVRLELQLAPGLPAVRVDCIQVEQVLVNLVRNGLEAVEPLDAAERWLRVQTALDGARIVVSVRDGGPGVPPDLAERVFEPFFTTKPGGMGIGLAISRSIAEAQGGSLTLQPGDDGRGTVFRLALPRQREDAA